MKKVTLTLALALMLGACGGESEDSEATVETQKVEQTEQVKQESAAEGSQPAEGEVAEATGDPAKGEQLFKQYCSACHGQDAKGIQGVGPSLVNNEFVKSKSNAELVQFVIEGRPANHPENKTGIPMPPKGGFDILTEEEITDIVAYLKTLEGNS